MHCLWMGLAVWRRDSLSVFVCLVGIYEGICVYSAPNLPTWSVVWRWCDQSCEKEFDMQTTRDVSFIPGSNLFFSPPPLHPCAHRGIVIRWRSRAVGARAHRLSSDSMCCESQSKIIVAKSTGMKGEWQEEKDYRWRGWGETGEIGGNMFIVRSWIHVK